MTLSIVGPVISEVSYTIVGGAFAPPTFSFAPPTFSDLMAFWSQNKFVCRRLAKLLILKTF